MTKELAFITGASSGIGYQLAYQLAERGYDLALTAHSNRLVEVTPKLESLGARVFTFQADATDHDEISRVWKAVEALERPVTVACINAGIGEFGHFVDESNLEQELAIVAINCASTVQFGKCVAKQMAERGSGNILFTASLASETVSPYMAVYSASKAFVLSLAKSLRYELKDVGVNVTALQPGPVDTNFFEVAHLTGTKFATEGKKFNEPDVVARSGLDALFKGEESVYASDWMTKLAGAVVDLTPDSVQAAMQKKIMQPADE